MSKCDQGNRQYITPVQRLTVGDQTNLDLTLAFKLTKILYWACIRPWTLVKNTLRLKPMWVESSLSGRLRTSHRGPKLYKIFKGTWKCNINSCSTQQSPDDKYILLFSRCISSKLTHYRDFSLAMQMVNIWYIFIEITAFLRILNLFTSNWQVGHLHVHISLTDSEYKLQLVEEYFINHTIPQL